MEEIKRYQIIYADPPWWYNDKRVSITSDRPQKYGGITYPVMKTEEICNLPVLPLADNPAVLFIWVTMPLLPDGIRVIKAWGFTYTTCVFVWIKINKSAQDNMFFTARDIRSGLGSYTNANAELCLLGRRGKCLDRKHKDVKQIILAPVEKHSSKPPQTRARILDLYGDLSRIELFARQKTLGWDVWGNEVKSDIELNVDKNE